MSLPPTSSNYVQDVFHPVLILLLVRRPLAVPLINRQSTFRGAHQLNRDAFPEGFKFNFDAYRFSISWSRIFPNGTGSINWEGVDYYDRLIDYLILQGITPYANLYHYDLPLALHKEYLGWLSPKIVDAFANYADFCFERYGDRVKNWFTFNEPRVVSALGYDNGLHAPGRCTNCKFGGNSTTEPYIVTHNLILSHAAAVKRYREKYQMCSIRFSSFFSCVVPLLSLLSIGNPRFAAGAHQLNRDAFPEGFVFGTAASAYQVEGMALKGGRGPSIWDAFVRIRKFYSFVLVTAGMIPNNATADVSVDEYHHYKEDIDIMKKFNFDAYRFSISWSRIFPNGTGSINWEGVDYYDRLIDYLILQGITPYANLYHYDLPLALHKEYLAAVKRYREKYQVDQKGKIGILLDFVWYEAYTHSANDEAAAQRARDFHIGWFLHPLTYGYYPKSIQEIVKDRLPKFTADQVKMVKGSYDYVGVNQYTSYYMKDNGVTNPKPVSYQDDWHVEFKFDRDGVPIGPRAHSGWLYIVPWGMYKAVTYVKVNYGDPVIILAENGNVTLPEGLRDTKRINYYRSYITELKRRSMMVRR
ncbi:Glycosyl hydrolase family 1 [Musa troglodytarum]|uniref:Glycosyl hydrolase family 1 n=1 Tax=Musa troglodytarum TaxID=320322 RepID=A0A9E7JGB1_9LILI|nr:Glycosyl hydrolase family 1 [Musa troglodytarum]